MRYLEYRSPGVVVEAEAEAPVLSTGVDALVRPIAAATCDLDIGIVRGFTPWEGPIPLGHEGVGEVLEVGDRVEGIRVGDVVAVPYQVSCGTCGPCTEALTAHCTGHGGSVPGHQYYGFSPTAREWGGIFADVVRVPFADHMLVQVPAGVDPATVASLGDNITDGWRSVARALEARPGSEVLIVGGSGAIGLYAVGAAVGLGASKVVYVDRSKRRLAKAENLGAEVVPLEALAEGPLGTFPITVDANSTAPGLNLALKSTAPAGQCNCTGMHFGLTELPLFELYERDVNLAVGLIQARRDMPHALALVESGGLDAATVIDRVLPWDQAAEELATVREKLVFVRDRITTSPA